MQSQIIATLDGLTNAEAILPHALFFARETGSDLTLLRVILPPGEPAYGIPYIPDDWYAGEVRWTRNYLGELAARLESQGVRVHTHYVQGVAAGGAITSYAMQHPDTQLIALASNGRGPAGLLLFGNVAGEVFATAPTSLLLLHPARDEQLPPGPIKPASYQTIVVSLDGTATSKQALARATTLAQDCHASLLLVAPLPTYPAGEVLVDEVVGPVPGGPQDEEKQRYDFLEGQAEHLRITTGLTVETAVDDGNPATFIERYFGKDQQQVLIVTTREQAETKALSFLHHSNAPVLFFHAS